MEKVSETVQVASIGKRIGGFLIDFGITFVLYLILLYSLGANVLSDAFGAKSDTMNYFAYATDSGLFEYTDNKKTGIQVVGTSLMASSESNSKEPNKIYQTTYYPALKYFFGDFLKNDARVEDRKTAGLDYLYTNIFKLPSFDSVKGLKVNTDDKKLYGESPYYRYALNSSGEADPSIDIVLQDKYQAIINGNNVEEKNKLINQLNAYYYGANDSLFLKANESLVNQKYYLTLSNHSKMANWSIRLICYLPISFVIFSLIPLLTKNGETIGKFALKTCLSSKDGYSVSFKQKAIRSSFMFFFTFVPVIAPVSSLYLFFGFALLCLVNYVMMIVNKDNQFLSFEDRIAGTIVISKPHSQIFANARDKETHFLNKGQTQKTMGEGNQNIVDVASVSKTIDE